ncbi:hypothetical protein H310_08232 [Aphanomyces invadans]|uniref:Uncharacterized protein n=1 Tax=Aphanomyces invadans TaxID=157072 RepID=A0A024U0Z6_9STRA|nr:hypothetical protein H310_08232 [Aphanomyces invadans]ETV99576.1 hypothetical protein H310_08232 [Aphanomyces invadans]|eukprot:XP_008872132.1 hypothetical protein H310_08232 [Aphanomyces invadans]
MSTTMPLDSSKSCTLSTSWNSRRSLWPSMTFVAKTALGLVHSRSWNLDRVKSTTASICSYRTSWHTRASTAARRGTEDDKTASSMHNSHSDTATDTWPREISSTYMSLTGIGDVKTC